MDLGLINQLIQIKKKDKKHTCIDLIYTIIHNLSKFLQGWQKDSRYIL